MRSVTTDDKEDTEVEATDAVEQGGQLVVAAARGADGGTAGAVDVGDEVGGERDGGGRGV